MSFRNKGLGWSQALGVAIASTVSFYANSSVAQITPDQTLPTNSNVTLEDNIRTITGGTQAGENLFHSFREFSVPTGSEAFFNNGADIRNIISRVTGGSISNIDGLIRANGANLFLMNPNGIVFGPNARLGVGGSFLATSANSMKFDNGSEFSAVNPQSPPLLTINVPLGLQLGTNSGSIRVEGNGEGRRTPDSPIIDTQDALRVGSDKTLALVGGDIELEGATLKTAGGRIELGSVAGNGFVGLTPDNKGFALDYGGVENFGDIRLSQQANVDASGAGAGDVKVQSRRLSLTDGSRIETSTLGASEGGNLVVNATESVETMGRFGGLRASVYRDATGNGGDLNIRTGQLVVGDGAQVSTSTFGAGKGGNLAVTADDSIQVIGRSAGGESSSGLFARTNRGATGNAGDLTIKTGELVVRDGAQVSANTNGAGIGGNLTVTASESIQLIGIGKSAGGSNVVSGLFAQTLSRATGAGDGGDLNIEAGELVAQDGARVGTSTFGAGNAGNLKVNSAQKVKLSGTSSDGESRSGLLAVAFSRATGEAGNITIETGDLLVENGAEVSAKTFSPGKGGDLTVNATNKVELVGRSPIKNQDTSGLFTETGSAGKAGNLNIKTGELVVRDGAEVSAITFGAGDAGDLTIKTGELLVRDGARVDASTSGAGKGGNLTVTADDSIQVIGRSAGGENSSGLFARARRGETGNAGNLTIQTDQLVVRDGAQVSTSTSGAGKGGNLTVTARESIQLIGRSADDRVSSGLFARTGQGETGDAGNLTIKTSDLVVQDGAQVSANTNGAGRGGNLTIIAGESIKLIGIGKSAGGSNVPSGLFAQTLSRATGAGDGGDLNIEAGELVAQDGARVGTSTFGAGNAGNLKVNSAQKVKLSGTSSDGESRSGLLAVAFSRATGEAGNITIETGDLLVENGAEVSAKTFSPGNGGNLTVNATNKVELVGRSPIKNQDTSGLFTETGNDQIRNARNGGELGNAGNLTINTQELLISDGANVNANTFGAGNAGNLTVNASENIQIIGRSSRLSARAGLGATGDAGDLTIKTGELVVRDGAFVDVGTFGAGKG